MPSWFLLCEPEPLPAAENMARDEHLFNLCHETKRGFLRLYGWRTPTFSIGVSQPARRALDLEFIRARGCEYVRRLTSKPVQRLLHRAVGRRAAESLGAVDEGAEALPQFASILNDPHFDDRGERTPLDF